MHTCVIQRSTRTHRPWVRKNINTNTDRYHFIQLAPLLFSSIVPHTHTLFLSSFLFLFSPSFPISGRFLFPFFSFISVFFECINQPMGVIIIVLSFFSTSHFKPPPPPHHVSSLPFPSLPQLFTLHVVTQTHPHPDSTTNPTERCSNAVPYSLSSFFSPNFSSVHASYLQLSFSLSLSLFKWRNPDSCVNSKGMNVLLFN